MSSHPDLSRLQRAQDLDPQALASIYDEYHEDIYRYMYRRVGDREIARDLAATVFQRLLQAYHDRRGPDRNVRAWLYRTGHNAVVDHYRRAQHRRHLPLEETRIPSGNNPAQAVADRLAAERVRQAMKNLTPDQQQVVVLKFLQGLSNEEVAEVLGKTVGSVKSLQHRALAALNRELVVGEEKVTS